MIINGSKYVTGIKVLSDSNVKLIKLLKKYRPNDAFSSIKTDIDRKDFVFACNSLDSEAYDQLLKCYNELKKEGYKAYIYEDGEKQDIRLIRNWSKTMHEISDEIDHDDSWLDEDN